MRLIRFVPDNTRIRFVRARFIAFALTGALVAATIASLSAQGLNLGIDFRGGILIEAVSIRPVNLADIRAKIGGLDLGAAQIQRFGPENSVLIRIPPPKGGDEATQVAVARVKSVLGAAFSYRRVEAVGPKVGDELLRSGLIAIALALLAIAASLWPARREKRGGAQISANAAVPPPSVEYDRQKGRLG